jgi:hypothetical protein
VGVDVVTVATGLVEMLVGEEVGAEVGTAVGGGVGVAGSGLMKGGGTWTVTRNEPVVVFPAASVAVQVTV